MALSRERVRRTLVWLLLCVLVRVPASVPPEPAPPQNFDLLVFSQPLAGREREFNEWYDREQAPDMLAIPGFVRAQRYELADQQLQLAPPKPQSLVIYQLRTSDLAEVYAEMRRRRVSGQIRSSAAVDPASVQTLTYRYTGPRLAGALPDVLPFDADVLPPLVQLVFFDPRDGRDAELNTWSDAYQVPQLLGIPGFTAGQRLALADLQFAASPDAAKYLTLFDIQTRALGRTVAAFQRRMAAMTPAPALDGNRLAGYTYQAVGLPLNAALIRAQRAAGH